MRRFEDYHPLVQFLYYLAVGLTVTVIMHPYVSLLSLVGALSLWFVRRGSAHLRSHLFYLVLFFVVVAVNLLFRHNGATVLLVVNHNPVTLEALLYGVAAAVMLLAVMYWCRSLSDMMTSDRLLYLFGKLSPRIALILSMALRYIPLFSRQAAQVQQTRKAMGADREDTLIDRIRAATATTSVMVTWSLENGIVTADSMAARGYGVGRRTSYHLFRLHRDDVAFLITTLLLTAAVVVTALLGAFDMAWYPYVTPPRTDAAALLGYLAYAALALLPTVLEIGERIRWKCLQSNI